MTAQEHINEIQQRWTDVNPISASTTANALQDIIHSIFGDAARIGYELLQNADDAAFSSNQTVDVKYYLLDNHLVISHNGSHFNSANIEAICRYGANNLEQNNTETDKQSDINKIGYKGIGFKSVFNIADKVCIFSKDYSFRFDKSHWGNRPMPWQIMPIYTEGGDIPDEVQPFLNFDNVNFILEFKSDIDKNNVKRKIAESFKNEQILLFLRSVSNLELQYKDPNSGLMISYRKIVRYKDNYIHALERHENNVLKESSRWHVTTFQLPVPEHIRHSVVGLDKRQCPEKLKNAEEIDLSLAAKIANDNSIIPLKSPVIFSYLPTLKKYDNLHFYANSNFLLNEARTELLNVQWNEFLFEQIGYYQFEWFKEMTTDERFKFEFVGLLSQYTEGAKGFNGHLNKGVKRAQMEIAFVPVVESNELKKAPNTIVDKTGICTEMTEYQLVKEEFEQPYEIADPKIKDINNLLKVGAHEFNRQNLRDAIIRGKRFSTPDDNSRLLDFFHKHISSISNSNERNEWHNVLRETPFLLDQDNVLREPPALYFPEEKPELPIDLPMAFLHEIIYQNKVKQNPALELWLRNLGTVSPQPIEIIRNGLFPMIEHGQINNHNVIPITRYIFSHQNKLIETDYQKLSKLPLLTKGNSLREAMICYLADEYQPTLNLESHIRDDIYVSLEYLSEYENVESWRLFWLRLKVRQDMELELHEIWYNFQAMREQHYGDYLNFLNPFLLQHNENGRRDLFSLLIPR